MVSRSRALTFLSPACPSYQRANQMALKPTTRASVELCLDGTFEPWIQIFDPSLIVETRQATPTEPELPLALQFQSAVWPVSKLD